MAEFDYTDMLPTGPDETPYRLLTTDGVRTVEAAGRTFLEVAPEALRLLTETAMHDIAHYLRPAHLAQLRRILDDPEASPERPVRRARPAEERQRLRRRRPADVPGHRHRDRHGQARHRRCSVPTGRRAVSDEEAISRGVYDAYTRLNLRYSQMAPLTMWDERNTGTNLPAQIELYADTAPGHETTYKFLFMAKGGGSREQVLPLPGDQGGPEPRLDDALPRREAALARHRGLPAVPPRDRRRRHERRVRAEDREVRERQVPRHAADVRVAVRARLPRPRPRAAGARADPAVRDRRAVRRQVLLPRRPRRPAAAARRLAARSRSPCRARPTGRRSARSPPRACSSSSSRPTPRTTCPTPTDAHLDDDRPAVRCASTSTGR